MPRLTHPDPRRDPVVREGCARARQAARLCDLLDGAPSFELGEALRARQAGMSYQELQQYDVDSAYYDPDVGPYYWEG